jgi:hypothetical protein
MVEPFIVKRLFGSNDGLDKKFKLIVAGFANIPVGYVKVIPVVNRLPDGLSTHITGNGLHIVLLPVSILYDGLPTVGRKPIIVVYFNSELQICRVGFEAGPAGPVFF